eukprot:gene4617-9172_t
MSDSVNQPGSDLGKILDFWREFDLDGKRLTLDKQCLEMREFKSNSVNGRKRLNDITKAFRSKTKDDQLIMMTEVLKAYQEEIDQLSRRSKFSESAFHYLYKAMYEAPDPVPVIDNLLIQLASASTYQLEIERLKGELTQYEQEFLQLKNQDITIRRLEDQLEEYREDFEEKLAAALDVRVNEAEDKAEQRVNEVKEHQRAVEKRLAAAVEAMRQAQASSERAQSMLFEASSQAEIRVSALMAENSLLAEGAERTQSRVSELEREVEHLRASGQMSSATTTGGGRRSNENDIEELQSLQLMVADLRQDARRKEEAVRLERQRLESTLRELSQQVAVEREGAGRLRQELLDRPTKEDLFSVRRQLGVLQRIAFNVQDEDCEEMAGDPERILGEQGQLEALLTTRMKSLEGELAEARRTAETLRKQETQSKSTIASLRVSLEASAALVSRLETDLEKGLGSRASSASQRGLLGGSESSGVTVAGDMGLSSLLLSDPDPSPGGPWRSSKGKSGVYSGKSGREDSNALNRFAPEESRGGGHSSEMGTGTGTGGDQMTAILQAQRDRYKDRLTEAEMRVVGLQQEVREAMAAKEQLETDNLALYGKISECGFRSFVRSYKSRLTLLPHYICRATPPPQTPLPHPTVTVTVTGLVSGAGRMPTMMMTDIEQQSQSQSQGSSSEMDVEQRYRNIYETRMNPFAQFSHHEKQRKLQELSVADRIHCSHLLVVYASAGLPNPLPHRTLPPTHFRLPRHPSLSLSHLRCTGQGHCGSDHVGRFFGQDMI